MMRNAGHEGVQSIARAASLLRALGRADGAPLGAISSAVGLPKSTVHRLLAALAAEGLVQQLPDGRTALGPELARLGLLAERPLAQKLRPVLEELRAQVGETVDLSVLDGAGVRFIDQLPGEGRLTALSGVGERFPLHCTANGKALLAALAPARARQLLAAEIGTGRALRELERELELVRHERVAYDREEHSEGISAVGAAVLGRDGPVAAISLPAPSARFAANERRFTHAVLHAAEQAGELLAA